MIAILVAAVSLITQACLIGDLDDTESMKEAALLEHYRAQAEADAATYRWPDETDSSRTAGTPEAR